MANKQKKVVVTIGEAESGKSTYIGNNNKGRANHKGNTIMKGKFKGYTLISADNIRFRILNSFHTKVFFNPKIEKQVWKEVWESYDKALELGENIVFDATNLTFERRYPIVCRARRKDYFISFIWFQIDFEILMERDRGRDRKVGLEVLMKQHLALKRFKPESWEYDELLNIVEMAESNPAFTIWKDEYKGEKKK